MPNVDYEREVEELRVVVERDRTVKTSAIALLNGHGEALATLRAQLEALGVTVAQLAPLDAYATALSEATEELATAVTANTPTTP